MKNNKVVFAIAFVLLITPILYTFYYNELSLNISDAILGTIGVSLFIFTAYLILKAFHSKFAMIFTLIVFVVFFLIRLIFSFLYDFSGRGFTNDFFAHFGWKSFIVGFDEYGIALIIATLLLLGLCFLLGGVIQKYRNTTFKVTIIFLLLSSSILFISYNSVPEILLIKAYNRFNEKITSDDNLQLSTNNSLKLLAPLRNKETLPIKKNNIETNLPEIQKNLIIIYLESFSEILSNNDSYPNLTPNIDRLKKDNFYFENNYSSGYVTIEGIANSQCGTLMNMGNGNNSLTNVNGRLPNLPCLGDILKVSNYHQVFMGGADLAFAGKGAFFKEHGYNEVFGIEDWKNKGFTPEYTWGLTDSNLFNEALSYILKFKSEDKPFNLTLLTLGTHVPGFSYKGCPSYDGQNIENAKDPFIQAIHCTDFLVGEFIEALKAKNILENTVVYIQGDHTVFPTHKMKSLFGDKALDRRVLSLVLSPTELSIDPKKPTSSLNLAATSLDLLGIKHNVDFLFGKSDLKKNNFTNSEYFITRYSDIYQGQVFNNSSSCQNPPDRLTLPLDDCEKSIALNAIYKLNSNYSQLSNNKDIHCELGSTININPITGKIDAIWGKEDISNKFYTDGRTFNTIKKGVYLISLNNQEQINKQLFFSLDNLIDIKTLKFELSNSEESSKIILLTNLTEKEITQNTAISFSESFIKNKFIFAELHDGKLTNINADEKIDGEYFHILKSCTNSAKLVMSVNVQAKQSFCDIENWGPQKTLLGESFILQPNGLSAFWLKTECAPLNSVLRLNSNELKTIINLPVITAGIDDKIYFTQVGKYTLDLYDKDSTISKTIGEFEVLPNEKYTVPKKKISIISSKPKPPVLLAHAAGGVNNISYLNSLEALNYNYKLGHRFFEIDFNWTIDQQLVAIHDWKDSYAGVFNAKSNETPTYQEFMDLQMMNNHTQLSLTRINDWLVNHPDAFIITDIKGKNLAGLEMIKKVLNKQVNQIIPQMYHPNNYQKILDLGYKDIIFTLYQTSISSDLLVKFINENYLFAVTINPAKVDFQLLVTALGNGSVFLYAHTINSNDELNDLLSLGIDGVYTDFLNSHKLNSLSN